MKIDFHLYSTHANCKHCMHLFHKMDQSTSDPGHCSIIGSDVEDDYYCSFYRMKKLIKPKVTSPTSTSNTTVNPCGEIELKPDNEKEDRTKPKKL